jgi:polar amino acid transport system substrate-binding protein
MNKAKKLIVLLLSLTILTLAFTACTSNTKTNEASKDNTSNTTASEATKAPQVATGTARSLQEIKDSGKVIIGVFSDKKPFGYVDENGTYQGYDVYYGNRIAQDLGVEVEYVAVDPASRVEYLETAKVDIILANFTVTKERAEKVDFALPYMKVSLGVVSKDSALITEADQLNGKTLIVAKGTTAETYFTENYPEVKLLKFDQYADAYSALIDGRGDAFSTDNTEVLAWAIENKGFTVGIESLGSLDTIAGAVQKGNTELLNWLNEELKALGEEQFFHANYEETLAPVYGDAASPDNLVVEGGVIE